ncbi:MAG: chemotaxis protein CheW [Silvanigrellaceae bacterium]
MNLVDNYLSFIVGGERFAISLKEVREVVPLRDLAPVPFTPDYIQGILNLRGSIVTVIDLGKRFELKQTQENEEESILIVEHNQTLLGLKIDSMDGVIHLSAEELAAPPDFGETAVSRFMTALVRRERQFIVVLGTEKLFLFDEFSSPAARSESKAAV